MERKGSMITERNVFNNKKINEGSILNHVCSRLLGKNVLEIVNCVPKLKLIDMRIIKSEI